MKKSLLLLPAFALVLAGCTLGANVDVNETASPSPATMESRDGMENEEVSDDTTGVEAEAGVMVGGAMMVPTKTIAENAMLSKEHTTLVAAVQAAGLAETLNSDGPFTVFAPTNAAFTKLPTGTVETLIKPENKDKLTSILKYHVVPGRYTSTDLEDGMTLTTVQGADLTVRMESGTWMVEDATGGTAKITTPDVMSSNGVTFVVDSVLMPN